MKSERKICQNCKTPFEIAPEDFEFYEKIKVPPPTFCPDCRFQRRAAFRNERKLFWNKSAKTGKSLLSLFSSESNVPIFTEEEWQSDDWDPMSYGRDYDFSRPFFEQFNELLQAVPRFSRSVINMQNSDFCANAGSLKNCYLLFNSNADEDCAYGNAVDNSRDCFDNSHLDKCERCYGSFWLQNSYQTHFSVQCIGCNSVWFSKNCRECTDCFGCVNLHNQKHHIFNVGYSSDEYKTRLEAMELFTHRGLDDAREQAYAFWQKFPNKYLQGIKNEDVTGEYITHSKNVKSSYLVREGENLKYVQYMQVPPNKDCYDQTVWGQGNQLTYENVVSGIETYNVHFSFESWNGIQDMEYCAYCSTSSNLFGCNGLRKKQYCILNKQYTKEEYETLVPKIIEHMNSMPYQDKAGRVYKYGEFFPIELSTHAYNTTIANTHFPLSKEEATSQGYRWDEPKAKEYEISMPQEKIPGSIREVTEEILKETLQCANCKRAYKVIKQELAFLQREGIPLPRRCHECRFAERLAHRNGHRLYKRGCDCGGITSQDGIYKNGVGHFHGTGRCPNKFETSYAPERKDIVFCEQCYQAEVV